MLRAKRFDIDDGALTPAAAIGEGKRMAQPSSRKRAPLWLDAGRDVKSLDDVAGLGRHEIRS